MALGVLISGQFIAATARGRGRCEAAGRDSAVVWTCGVRRAAQKTTLTTTRGMSVSAAIATTTATLPLDPLVQVLADMLRAMLLADRRCQARALRQGVSYASWILPLVCREARALSALPGIQWLWLYEMHVFERAGTKSPAAQGSRFCEGLPPFFDPNVQALLPSGEPRGVRQIHMQNVLNPTSVINTRKKMASLGKSLFGVVHDAPDLAALDIPPNVRAFVGGLRELHSEVARRPYCFRRHIVKCSAEGCNRPAALELGRYQCGFSKEYHALRDLRLSKPIEADLWPHNRPFCCLGCAKTTSDAFFRVTSLAQAQPTR